MDGEEGNDTYYFDPAVGNLGSNLLFDVSGDWDTLDFRNFTADDELDMNSGGVGSSYEVTAGVHVVVEENEAVERLL